MEQSDIPNKRKIGSDTKKSECTCACHNGAPMLHFMPCCYPDEEFESDNRISRFIKIAKEKEDAR